MVVQKQQKHGSREEEQEYSNEYVLNIAFLSFLGFTALQTGFAIIAKSTAMMADSEAMAVDALTYLFNLLAEHLKHQPYSEKEKILPHADRHRRRKLKRLYLELIPPFISIVTLVVVTIFAINDGFKTLLLATDKEENQPDLTIMLFFSGLNLLLDIVNVACFAKTDQGMGLPKYQDIYKVEDKKHDRVNAEKISLLEAQVSNNDDADREVELRVGQEYTVPTYNSTETNTDHHDEESTGTSAFNTACEAISETGSLSTDGDFHGVVELNLNMCSAWTHICADTLRSIAVLSAAGIAFVSDGITAQRADALAAIVVSFIIIFSLGPLVQGIYLTVVEIKAVKEEIKIDSCPAGQSHTGTVHR